MSVSLATIYLFKLYFYTLLKMSVWWKVVIVKVSTLSVCHFSVIVDSIVVVVLTCICPVANRWRH